MAQVSDTKDIGGDTWKEAGVGEFARTFGGNWGGKLGGSRMEIERNVGGNL